MAISLSNYQPFDYTKSVIDFGREKWDSPVLNFLELCKKVGCVALAILAFLPALMLDLVLTASTWLCREINPESPPPVHQPAAPPIVQAGAIDPRLIDRVLANPYPHVFPFAMNNQTFFRDALIQAFEFHDEATKNAYKELIEAGGIGEDNPRIEIYQWTAGCLLAHYLRARSHGRQASQYYPQAYPDLPALNGNAEGERQAVIRAHIAAVVQLQRDFNGLPIQMDKAIVLLKIIIPERQWQLSDGARRVVNQINAMTIQMNQDAHYRREIFTPVTNDIENI